MDCCQTLTRRTMVMGALAFPLLSACANSTTGAAPPSGSAHGPTTPVDQSAAHANFVSLEHKYRARLGVYALAPNTGASLAYRADERFSFCSTFKVPAAAAVLQRHPLSYLDTVIKYTKEQVNSLSPVTEQHTGTGMTVRQLCDAAIRYSDGTAGNLLMRDVGGPAGLTAFFRGLGDTTSRIDQYEPQLNWDSHDDARDTTTPRACAGLYNQLMLGTAIPPEKQALIKDWMVRNTTGSESIRAGVPKDWTVADKTGHGGIYGRVNDIAIAWDTHGKPIVIAVLSDSTAHDDEGHRSILADAANCIASTLHQWL